jgi:hypothetical protein
VFQAYDVWHQQRAGEADAGAAHRRVFLRLIRPGRYDADLLRIEA